MGVRLPGGNDKPILCGDYITKKDANLVSGMFDVIRARAWGRTSEVGAYWPNPWGLFDVHGNVWEWVEDLWHVNYKGAPTNGSAWHAGGDQSNRVLHRVARTLD